MIDTSIIGRAVTGDNSERLAAIAAGAMDDALKASGQFTFVADAEGVFLDVQGAFQEILGRTRSELISMPIVDLIAPETVEKTASAITAVVTTGEPQINHETTVVWPDGQRREVRAGGVIHRGDKDGTSMIVGVVADITAEVKAKRHLEINRLRFFDAFQMAPVGILLVHLDPKRGAYVWRANDEACFIADMTREEVEGRWMRDIGLLNLSEPERASMLSELTKLESGEVSRITMNKVVTTPTGIRLIVRFHIAPLDPGHWRVQGEGLPVNGTIHLEDVTAQVTARNRLQYLASHDALTGLLDRQFFTEELDRHLSGARAGDFEGILISIDLDEFKIVNDTWGHHSGDKVLIALSEVLRSTFRDGDKIARLGGDEFAAFLPGANAGVAEEIAGKLKARLNGAQIRVGDSKAPKFTPRASFGVLVLAPDGYGAELALQRCDELMYQAKNAGGDTYVISSVGELTT